MSTINNSDHPLDVPCLWVVLRRTGWCVILLYMAVRFTESERSQGRERQQDVFAFPLSRGYTYTSVTPLPSRDPAGC